MNQYINAKDFGAVGDGVTNDTAAIQAAIDEAAKTSSAVFLGGGVYLCGMLQMRSHTALVAEPVWGYRQAKGAVIKLADPSATCQINITGALGATLYGLVLEGGRLGENVHGVMLDNDDFGPTEHNIRIDKCRIDGYSGDGVHLNRIWVFSLRSNMISHHGGHSVYVYGWDGWVLDNWLTGCGGAGFYSTRDAAAITFTANRVEWNRGGGFVLSSCSTLIITGNSFDRNGGPALHIKGDSGYGHTHTITGNIFNRNGANHNHEDPHHDCQVYLTNMRGITMVGNATRASRGDQEGTNVSPSYGIVYGNLSHAIIKDNMLLKGAQKELFVDLGGNDNVIFKDNIGTLFES